MPTNTDKNSILALLQIATKARRGGGRGGGGVASPGSRGGKFWISPSGHVEYGAKPSGARGKTGGAAKPAAKPQAAVRTGVGGGSGKPVKGELRAGYRIKPQTAAGKVAARKRMLSEMDRALKTGTDPHGNKLDAKSLAQLQVLAIQLRTQIGGNVKKEITEVAASRLPFTVFKDKAGQYRWVGISSSAAQDHDGETVSLKALAEDVSRKDITGTHGPLNWWHTQIKLGNCDFNAMDGPLLVESGTFVNDRVAVAVSKAISEGKLKPAMSLEFEHNEPGPPVLPGRVFTRINKIGRALLPAEKASNLLTSFKVYSLKSTALAEEKDSKKMLDDEKHKKALEVFGQDTLQALLDGNQTALKMAELMNLSFKSATVAEPPTPVAPEPQPVVVEPVAPAVVEPLNPEPAPVVNEVVAETEPEDAQVEIDPAVMFESLSQSVADKVLASLATSSATSTKEVSDLIAAQTVALKENTGALNKVVAENVALKARLDALEGNLPAGVRARVTQQPGISAKQLEPEHAGIVTAEKNVDPYVRMAGSLIPGLVPAPRG